MALTKIFAVFAFASVHAVAAAAPGSGSAGRWNFFGSRARPVILVPGRLPESTSIDDEDAAHVLGLTPGEWARRLEDTPPRDRVHAAARALTHLLFRRGVSLESVRDQNFYPHLPESEAKAAATSLRHEVPEVLGLSRDDLQKIDLARAGRAFEVFDFTHDVSIYAAAIPRVTHALALIEAMGPGALTNDLRRMLRELKSTLRAAEARVAELAASSDETGLVRGSTAADDRAAADLMGLTVSEWSDVVTDGERFRVPQTFVPFESRRGVRAASAFVARLLSADDLTFAPGAAFYPRYVQHDDLRLRRQLREHVLATLGLSYRFAESEEQGVPQTEGRQALLQKARTDDRTYVEIDLRLLRAIARVRHLAPSFLVNVLDQTLAEVRTELVASIEALDPKAYHAFEPTIRRAALQEDFAIDDFFVLRVMAFDDMRVRRLLATFWKLGRVRSDPTFFTPMPRRSERRNLLARGFDSFQAFLEHELDEDLVMREQAERRQGRTHHLARARLAELREGFLALVREDCDIRLGGPKAAKDFKLP